jgi:hypothetical protein
LTARALNALREPRVAWAVLGVAMLCSTGLILFTAHGQSFAVDEILYYGRSVDSNGQLVHYAPFDPGYLLAPFNGHLPLGGRFVYELVFATVGAKYTVFVLINVAALLACVALTFELVRRRVGSIAALAPCIVLLFLGFAREQLLWPLDFNTAGSLAAGLGAVLAVQREDRRGDILACVLLAASIAMIELGLSFALGIAIWLAATYRREALRRAWIVALPIALYAIWWLWARKFGQSEVSASNAHLIPKTLLDGAASAMGSLTGTNPVLPGSFGTEVTWFGRALAIAAAVALAVRLWWRSLPRTIWVWLAVLASYWLLLAAAARGPEGSRYIYVSAVLVVLIAADTVRRKLSDGVAIALVVLALVALPANIAQLTEDRNGDTLHSDTPVSRTEFAMLELARRHVDPDYFVTGDPRVSDAGGALFIGITAGAYLEAAAHNGSIAYSLGEVRRQDERIRLLADAALVGALGVRTEPAAAPGGLAGCRTIHAAPGVGFASFTVRAGQTLLHTTGGGRTALWLARFADSSRSAGIDFLPPRRWTKLVIPSDAAPDPWRVTVDRTVTACPPS